jgi:hypothetical protein
MFGSARLNVKPDKMFLDQCAKRMLTARVDHATFNLKAFAKIGTDLIAIERGLSERMKRRWGVAATSATTATATAPAAVEATKEATA